MSKVIFNRLILISLSAVFINTTQAQPLTSDSSNSSTYVPKPVISWAKNSAPPFYQTNKESMYRSYGDHMQRFLEEKLPQYQHITVEMPLTEINQQWAAGTALCFSTMIHDNLTHKDYLLSIPNSLYEPHGIITRKKFRYKPQLFTNSVELSKLAYDQRYTMGKISKRSFGKIIDGILQDAYSEQKQRLISEGETIAALEGLSAGEFDYLIEYRYVFDFFKKHSVLGKNLKFLPINEVKNTVILGSVGCTNNAWGAEVIKDINNAIKQVVVDKEYQRNLVDWLATPSAHTKYLELYHKHLVLPLIDSER